MPKKEFKIKELTTERLLLRLFKKEDFDFVKTHFADENVSRYLYDTEPPTTNQKAQEVLDWTMNTKSNDHMRWGIALKDHPETLIGTCGFHCYDKTNNAAETGYDLSNKYWRKGYMSEALTRIIKYGFNELHLHKISAIASLDNTGSNKLLEKLGFKLDGVIRDKHLFRGKYYDHNLYSLLETE
jgi:[ribosomal protein S5]-alanine N-acetyltransferase